MGGDSSGTGGSGIGTGGLDLGSGGGNGTGADGGDPCKSDHPPADCELDYDPSGPGCGDAEVNVDGEECDDGNGLPGDGCSGACTIEPNFVCDETGCHSTIVCGDGERAGGEVCDDNNTEDGDGCAADCYSIEPDWDCPYSGGECTVHDPCTDPIPPPECYSDGGEDPKYCGDGAKNLVWEQCDDGNAKPGDGCSGACKVEPNWDCTSGTCVPTVVCGDGEVEGGEVCDDGDTINGNGCSSDCFSVTAGYSCPTAGGVCTQIDPCTLPNPPAACNPGGTDPVPVCGDHAVNQAAEQCDDGNTKPGDGCSGACKVEPNWNCSGNGGTTCVFTIVCGDNKRQGTEVCDDGNQISGDGCSDNCKTVDPNYTCPTAGGKCTSTVVCGDGRISGTEECEDGNATPNDGCTNCQKDIGYYCAKVGQPCTKMPVCGDGAQSTSEECDDKNLTNGDGCTNLCKLEPNFSCPTPGVACTPIVHSCGNGAITGTEQCDDKNTASGDGCSSTCQVETGFVCSTAGKACTPKCGDSLVKGNEVCDDGNVKNNDGCSSSCTWEPGFYCNALPPHNCAADTCGNSKKGTDEDCDDGNTRPGDGCDGNCQAEPSCAYTAAGCSSTCGDGLVIGEACDDGNTINGDGCSSTCTVEYGYACSQPTGCGEYAMWDDDDNDNTAGIATCVMRVPVTYRDFDESHPDFEPSPNGVLMTGLVQATLDANGKPVYIGPTNVCSGGSSDPCIQSVNSFSKWYRDDNSVNTAVVGEIVLWDNGTGGFVNRYGAQGEQWTIDGNPGTLQNMWCGNKWGTNPVTTNPNGICTTNGLANGSYNNDACKATDPRFLRCFATNSSGQEVAFGNAAVDTWYAQYLSGYTAAQSYDGSPLFFPLDNKGRTPTGQYHAADVPAIYNGGSYGAEPGGGTHNFHFTSEVRQWFQYESGKTYSLDFTGDDDVWVFINGRLAVDLGSYHEAAVGNVTIAANGTVSITNGGQATIVKNAATDYLLQNNKIYEIVVFQAERKFTASSYRLTLSGFNKNPSSCVSTCGDNKVASDEECDDGVNDGGYGECQPGCLLGARCGDAKQDTGEGCDNGSNIDGYNASGVNACAPGCKKPSKCGDSVTDFTFGEVCDNGGLNNDNTYNGCTSACQKGPHCGDGTKNGAEQCDDGINDGTGPQGCTPECKISVTCGDGIKQSGELCDDGVNNGGYNECAPQCKLGPYCGDGTLDVGYETCDDGTLDGAYGGCTASCGYAGNCGDGVVNGPEACDDGVNNGGYGECATGCVLGQRCGDGVKQVEEQCDDGKNDGSGYCQVGCILGPYCGDGVTDPGEECDDGSNLGGYGKCAPGCVQGPRCGDGQQQAGEECDYGDNNGPGYGGCSLNCQLGPFCGDAQLQAGEICDDGVNDGSYGACAPGCLQGTYCGDHIVQEEEQCDDGVNDGSGICQPGCITGPGCGDGILQAGETCDNGPSNGYGYNKCHPELCTLVQYCGDGQKNGTEQCDDGVNDGGYGQCAVGCVFGPRCGDAQLQSGEVCDDGVNDGGYGECAAGCKLGPYCGDGKKNGPEQCDDGNRKNGDGCSATCKEETIK